MLALMDMDSVEVGKLAGNAVLKKYGVSHYQRMNKLSQVSRFSGMSKEEKSEYFRKVRSGQKISA
jgi:hypothetical protein